MNITFHPLGEAAVKLSYNEEVSPSLTSRIQAFCRELASINIDGITEWVPAYDSVTVYYEPWTHTYAELTEILEDITAVAIEESHKKMIVTIPTLYGGEYGPDLEDLAKQKRMQHEDIIKIHTNEDYLVNMIGFLPGFPYLSGLDERIAAPRLDNPRQKVPAGSVGIAEAQTGVYPLESPGGWNIIGRTPLQLFQPEKDESFLLNQGDYLRFRSVTEEEFEHILEEVEKGSYEVQREEVSM
ncbi:5-oxoprolinase subunit PxpB [Guptibacillus algicola]|uniref:5-oxoprolinase subunit PxpB n=1 Tax=Guptibacillus algicola TaxID=225844 RepID=UPI001CD695A1|nr:5-oxoprolinase subunit PxpB [Alkalihalobacillus algicola]MCA0988884.1 5-oxoprolinase subunit PxpB [Alkalihalobacillus algicola]